MPIETTQTVSCDRCRRNLIGGPAFVFRANRKASVGEGIVPDPMTKCLPCALVHWPMLKRSLVAAVVVGTVLTGLNQGDLLLTGQWSGALLWKVPLTYCVPFVVATYGALTNSRR